MNPGLLLMRSIKAHPSAPSDIRQNLWALLEMHQRAIKEPTVDIQSYAYQDRNKEHQMKAAMLSASYNVTSSLLR